MRQHNPNRERRMFDTEEGRAQAQAFLQRMVEEHANFMARGIARSMHKLLSIVAGHQAASYKAWDTEQTNRAYHEEDMNAQRLATIICEMMERSYKFAYARSTLYDLTEKEFADTVTAYDDAQEMNRHHA